jgi:hypothetical protein
MAGFCLQSVWAANAAQREKWRLGYEGIVALACVVRRNRVFDEGDIGCTRRHMRYQRRLIA